jgi:hypothetical protein
MRCSAYIPGEGQYIDMYVQIGSLDDGVVSLWILIDDEVLQSWLKGVIFDQSDAQKIAMANETKLFEIITKAIKQGGPISLRGGPFRVTKQHLH